MLLRSGDLLGGRFDILEQLGHGGMGAVYKVHDRVLEETRALKVMLPSLLQRPGARQRFLDEVKIAQKLQHESVVRVHDLGRDQERGVEFYTMEYVEGAALSRLLSQRGGRLRLKEALHIVNELCKALEYAHRYTVHRDLKPQNIMVRPDWHIKVLDFGLAKLISLGQQVAATGGLGTAYYQAPEQLRGNRPVDLRADLYSVGVILYELLTGAVPQGLVKKPSVLAPEVPRALDDVVFRCLEPEPHDRYVSAAELRQAVRTALTTQPGTPSAPQPVRSGPVLSVEWWYVLDGREVGPLTWDQIRAKAASGKVTATTLVWNGDMKNWADAGTVPELRAAMRTTPPRRPDTPPPPPRRAETPPPPPRRPEAPPQRPERPAPQRPVAQPARPAARSSAQPGSAPGVTTKVDVGNGVQLEMVWCPPGSFKMGSENGDKDEVPVHQVTLARGFWMCAHPLTQREWAAVAGANPSEFRGDNRPVERISWTDCQEAITKLNAKVGGGFRLPTEAEWEYACRAGTTTEYYFAETAEDLGQYAWFMHNSGDETHPVRELKPNAWGLYDMHGNVWEWCQDCYHKTYDGAPMDGSAWEQPPDDRRVLRGGCWGNEPRLCRSSHRIRFEADVARGIVGVRFVRAAAS